MHYTLPIAVLISGYGSNLQAIIDQINANTLTASIRIVISDKPNAYGLVRAQQHHIPTAVVLPSDYPTRIAYDAAVQAVIEQANVELIVLSGFMRILSAEFVSHFQGKIVNIHPSLLPKYRGLHTYERALADRETEHGSTVHWVTADLDSGPIIMQRRLAILPNDTPETLKERTLALEHELYPAALQQIINQHTLTTLRTCSTSDNPMRNENTHIN